MQHSVGTSHRACPMNPGYFDGALKFEYIFHAQWPAGHYYTMPVISARPVINLNIKYIKRQHDSLQTFFMLNIYVSSKNITYLKFIYYIVYILFETLFCPLKQVNLCFNQVSALTRLPLSNFEITRGKSHRSVSRPWR